MFLAAAPLVVCFILQRLGKSPNTDAWLISLAFGLSFVMDMLMYQLVHFRLTPTWWVTYLGYPLQFGILLGVAAQYREARVVFLSLLGVVALSSILRDTLSRPETYTSALGGAAVSFLFWGVPHLRRFRWPIWLYGAFTIPSVWLMGRIPLSEPAWFAPWIAYKFLQLAALVLLLWTLVRKEVEHGLRLVDIREHQVGHN
jgi:hypothetical protein